MADILIIDDHDSTRQLYSHLLTREGYSVHTADNGKHAFEILNAQAVDLVITDIFMPEMDGYETIVELKSKFPYLPILAITGNSRLKDNLEIAQRLGADRSLEKSDTATNLISVVNELLQSC